MLLERADHRSGTDLGFRQFLHHYAFFRRRILNELVEKSALDPHHERIHDIRYYDTADKRCGDASYP